MKITILDDYQNVIESLNCFQLLDGNEIQIVNRSISNEDELAREIKGTEILVLNRTRTRVTRKLITQLPQLKLISQTGKLAGHVDLDACKENNVMIAEGKGNPIATAELTWSLILNGLRLLPQAIDGMKQGKWQTNLGDRVHGKTIGIWGYGKIGKRIAQYAKAFGAKVLVWGSESSLKNAQDDGFEAATSKKDFFTQVDVLSLHLRLHPVTTGIVKHSDLTQMKKTALFVNTARAALVEEGALEAALTSGRPGRAALDVYPKEPIYDKNYPLLAMPNVLCSPHLGYVERESYELYYSIAFENCINFMQGKPTGILALS